MFVGRSSWLIYEVLQTNQQHSLYYSTLCYDVEDDDVVTNPTSLALAIPEMIQKMPRSKLRRDELKGLQRQLTKVEIRQMTIVLWRQFPSDTDTADT